MSYDIVSFDLDGTLVDSASEIAEAANRALESHGVARQPAAAITLLIGHGTRELMLKLLARVLLEQPALASRLDADAVVASFDAHYAITTGTTSVLYDGARAALERLKAHGVKLACVTNKEVRHAVSLLRAHGLDHYFELIIGGDSLPEKKPHSSVLRHVASQLGADPRRMAHVGDSRVDIETARNAGVAAWAVPYGYNGGVPVAEAGPQRLFDSLLEVADHVIAARLAQAA